MRVIGAPGGARMTRRSTSSSGRTTSTSTVSRRRRYGRGRRRAMSRTSMAPATSCARRRSFPTTTSSSWARKASSSGAIKPPMAAELLDHYTPEQLRAHWISLGLGVQAREFLAPRCSIRTPTRRRPTPFSRRARCSPTSSIALHARASTRRRSTATVICLWVGRARTCVPACERAVLAYEEHMAYFEMHAVMAQMDEFLRGINKWWASESRTALAEDAPEGAVEMLLRDAFHYLRCATLLMHPIVPRGCELIFEHLAIEPKDGPCTTRDARLLQLVPCLRAHRLLGHRRGAAPREARCSRSYRRASTSSRSIPVSTRIWHNTGHVPEWRNGRRDGLKNRCPLGVWVRLPPRAPADDTRGSERLPLFAISHEEARSF